MIDRLDNIIAVKYFLSAFVKGLMDNSKRHTIDLTPDGLSKYDMLFKNSINSSTIQLEKNLQHIMYLIQHYVFDLGYKYEYIDAIDFDSIHNGGNVPVNDLYSTQLFKDISVYKNSYKSKQISGYYIKP